MNLHLSFETVIKGGEKTILYLTGSSVYRIFVNGSFIAIGPARCAHGFYKVDEIDLSGHLEYDKNALVIEVVGYNVNSFYTLDQPSFLTAEVRQSGEVRAYTGDNNFTCHFHEERVQRIQRYSFQRTFAESYRFTPKTETFLGKTSGMVDKLEVECAVIEESKHYLQRDVPYPLYEDLAPTKIIESALSEGGCNNKNIFEDRSYLNIGTTLKGYQKESLEEHLSTLYQCIDSESFGGESQLVEFPYNATGMIAFNLSCTEETTVLGLFDEILVDGDVDTRRLQCCNGIKLTISPGKHSFISFEPYTFKYLKLVTTYPCDITDIHIVEYKHPPVSHQPKLPENRPKLEMIYKAALETFLSNAVDVFTDCPSRERAGWLCDSFFLGRVENCLTGENLMEKSFLENYVLAERFDHLPQGMLPMCYPADHNDGVFIPNWAMWFVLELEEYYERSGDNELVSRASERVYGLVNYFKAFENELGLLEKLESWVFVEWSRAAEFVQDINYPSNMLYARVLEAVGHLYGDEECIKKSQALKKTIRERSYNGDFFTDNELREAGVLSNHNNITEVCQYYAFFTGVATPVSHPDLWQKLIAEFGPGRKKNNLHSKVHFANAFIGNYLRLELLSKHGYQTQMFNEIEDYFYYMAETTGTLWEHDAPEASCNHGLASHVIYWLNEI